MEYEERKTIESKLVWVLDKIDAHYQANQLKGGDIRYWADCPGGEIYYEMVKGTISTSEASTIKELNEDILKDLESAVVEISRNNMKKCNIEVGK